MHIIYIITKLELGGAQKVCLSLYEGFSQSPDGATLISGTSGPLVPQALQQSTTILLPSLTREVSTFGLFKEPKAFFDLVLQIRRLKKKYGKVVVHTHSTKAGILGRLAAFLAGADKIVHTVHGFGFNNHQSWPRWAATYLAELTVAPVTDSFIVVSQQDLNEGLHRIPGFKKKVTLIRAAANITHPQPTPTVIKKRSEIVIGSVSCFKPQKNLVELINAYAQVHTQTPHQTRLQIIGDGVERKKLETLIASLGLQKNIDLLGWQSHVSAFMKTWDIYAMSSLWEGLPCSIIEARMHKLPVVSYDTGGICEVIENGKNGFLIPQGKVDLLAQALINLTNDQELRTQLQGYTDNLQPFTQPSMIKAHKTLYESFEKSP